MRKSFLIALPVLILVGVLGILAFSMGQKANTAEMSLTQIAENNTATALVPSLTPSKTSTPAVYTTQVTQQVQVTRIVTEEVQVTRNVVVTASPTFTRTPTVTRTPTNTPTPNMTSTLGSFVQTQISLSATATFTPTFTLTPSETPNVVASVTAAYGQGWREGYRDGLPTATATLSVLQVNATRDAQVVATVAQLQLGSPTPSATFTPSITPSPTLTSTPSAPNGWTEVGIFSYTGNSLRYQMFVAQNSVVGDFVFWINGLGRGTLRINMRDCSGSIVLPNSDAPITLVSANPSDCQNPGQGNFWSNFTLVDAAGNQYVLRPN